MLTNTSENRTIHLIWFKHFGFQKTHARRLFVIQNCNTSHQSYTYTNDCVYFTSTLFDVETKRNQEKSRETWRNQRNPH